MSKYDQLGVYLSERSENNVRVRFAEIERILGFSLPRSAYIHRAWWSNNQNNNVMTRVWRKAGFRTEQVDMTKLELVFRRVPRTPAPSSRAGANGRGTRLPHAATIASPETSPQAPLDKTSLASTEPRRHLLFGALKGQIRLAAGTDITEPAGPEWGNIARAGSEK